MSTTRRVGIIGAGDVAKQYLQTLLRHPEAALVAVASRDPRRIETMAAAHDLVAMRVDDLIADESIDTILNLTPPLVHADLALRSIAAGKSVYGEKPLAVTRHDSERIVAEAKRAAVQLGCAPDTMLGTGIQTARRAIEEGALGTPTFALGAVVTPGHERWHPNPDFFYQDGAGPLFDFGPYWVSAFVHLLGPIVTATGSSSRLRDARTIQTGARAGQRIGVQVDSHVAATFEHANGALSTLLVSFDGVATTAPRLEVHGTEASMVVTDPNRFSGTVAVRGLDTESWAPIAPNAGYADAGRGIGLIDMIHSDAARPPRASGTLALHVVEAMEAVVTSSSSGRRISVSSRPDLPELVPLTPSKIWQSR